MKKTVLIVSALSFLGLLEGVWRLSLAYAVSTSPVNASRTASDPISLITSSVATRNREIYRKNLALANLAGIFPSFQYELGRATMVLSLGVPNLGDKISLFCKARQHFLQSTRESPHNPRYHIALADIEAQLPNPDVVCNRDFETVTGSGSEHPPSERLSWARKLAPFSTVDLYLASLVHLGLGEKDQALALLKLEQFIDPNFSEAQRRFTYRLVKTARDLRLAIPGHYPEVVYWARHFSSYRVSDYQQWRSIFEIAVSQALDDLNTRLREERLGVREFSTFVKSVTALPLVQEAPKLRVATDSILSSVYASEGNKWWSRFLKKRRKLNRISVLKALIADDKDPKQTMLFGWTHDGDGRIVNLDIPGRSVGIYLPPKTRLKMLILQNRGGASSISAADLEMLFSYDNSSYYPLDDHFRIGEGSVDGRQTFVVEFDDNDFRYLKIRCRKILRTPSFSNRFVSLIQVYGVLG